MLRKGGNSFIETNYDETNRFDIEDSPCNFSVASGLSDLTVGSNTVGLLKMNRFDDEFQFLISNKLIVILLLISTINVKNTFNS